MMRLTNFSLRTELCLILLIKVLLIVILWYVFFSDPVQSHLTSQTVATHFLDLHQG